MYVWSYHNGCGHSLEKKNIHATDNLCRPYLNSGAYEPVSDAVTPSA